MSDNTITNRGGHLVSVTGLGVEAFKLRALITMLRFRQNTGCDIDRRVPTIKTAQRETGLRTRDIPTLMAAVESKMAGIVAQCEVISE